MTAAATGGSPPALSVMVVEDEPLFRDLLVNAVLSQMPDATVTGSYPTAETALRDPSRVDVLLTDIDLGDGLSGVELGIQMRRRSAARGVVLLSNLSKPSLLATIPPDVQGGWSYLLKKNVSDIDQLGTALRGAAAGEITIDGRLRAGARIETDGPMGRLTDRQLRVLSLVATGLSNQRIADELHVGMRTIESSMSLILAQLDLHPEDGISTRVAAVLAYLDAFRSGSA